MMGKTFLGNAIARLVHGGTLALAMAALCGSAPVMAAIVSCELADTVCRERCKDKGQGWTSCRADCRRKLEACRTADSAVPFSQVVAAFAAAADNPPANRRVPMQVDNPPANRRAPMPVDSPNLPANRRVPMQVDNLPPNRRVPMQVDNLPPNRRVPMPVDNPPANRRAPVPVDNP